MNDLPPDVPRLRRILAHLDQQTAANETVHIYLELQRDAVLQALDAATGEKLNRDEGAPPPPPPPSPRPRRTSKPFKLGRMRTPDGPVPTSVHTADCHMAGDLAHAVQAAEARLAITDANVAPCQFCHPDELLDLADN